MHLNPEEWSNKEALRRRLDFLEFVGHGDSVNKAVFEKRREKVEELQDKLEKRAQELFVQTK